MAKIFEELRDKEIVYAVCCNTAYINNNSNKFGADWFILASAKDRHKLKKFKFKQSKVLRRFLIELELCDSEIQYFKKNSDKYNRVVMNNDGRVYELRDKSFKEYYEQVKRDMDS